MTRCSQSRLPSVRRALHAKKRLQQIQLAYPQIPDDILERCSLRQLGHLTKRLCKTQMLLENWEDIAACQRHAQTDREGNDG